MSLQSELTRLQDNVTSISSSKDAIMAALASKGVTVPAGATLHDVPGLIGQINGSAPEPPTPGTSVAIGGHTYKTVIIGNQEWLAENLDYKFDVNCSTIPIGGSGNPSTPHARYYNNDEATYGIDGTYKCGLLYNWHAVEYLEANKATLLPDGWHVPSVDEWNTLSSLLGYNNGTELKAVDNSITSNWPSNWNGTDDYGFNGIPSGNYIGTYTRLNTDADYWTSTDYQDGSANIRMLYYSSSMIGSGYMNHNYCSSIRLVKELSVSQ